MLWKCCTQYASTFGKLSSGHRTATGQFSFQSQRKAVQKNIQTTTQLYSSHTLIKECSKFSKQGFNNMWTVNFQIFTLVLEKAEEPKIKLPTYWIADKGREFQRIARRDKKAFLSNQCKEIEESSRMGKFSDLFKKIRDTKGTFHACQKWYRPNRRY